MKIKELEARAHHVAPLAVACLVVLLATAVAGPLLVLERGDTGQAVAGVPVPSSDPVIDVDGNTDLAGVPGITGSGTAGDPYIIENKTIDAGGTGSAIRIRNTTAHLVIRNCTATGSGSGWDDAGILLENVTNANVSGNNASDNGIIGIALFQSSHNIVSGNNVSGNFLEGIGLLESSHNTVSGNDVSGNTIVLLFSSNNTVSGNNVLGAHIRGIDLIGSSHNTVLGNNVSGNGGDGILVDQSSNDNTISGNNASGTNMRGIHLIDSSNNTVSGNNASGNGELGITLSDSSNNTVSDNTVSGNGWDGISLIESSNDNTVSGNNASGNGGLGIALSDSSNNTLFYNEVAGNTGAAQANCTNGTGNSWDNGTHGNFWGDYEARYPDAIVQAGGIWDTPYTIETCEDRFPLFCKPVEPTNVAATAGVRNVALAWDPPATTGISEVTHYSVYHSADNSTFEWLADVNAPETSFLHEGLDNSQTVYYHVTASNDRGEGLNSSIVVATTWDVPAQVTGLVATAGDGQVSLSWDAPADGGAPISAYHVHRNGTLVHSTGGGTIIWNDTTVVAGNTYTYTITAENAVGNGTASEAVTGNTVPAQVTGLVATAGDGQVSLSWDTPILDGGTPVTGYKIYRDGTLAHTAAGAATSWVDTGLTNGQQYTYFVVATNAVGDGPASSHADATPRADNDLDPEPGLIPGYGTWLVVASLAGGIVAIVLVTSRKRHLA